MSTLAEIEEAVEALPLPEQEVLLRHLSARLHAARVKASPPARQRTGFLKKWGGTARKIEDASDSWLTHINEKHLR